MGLSPDTFEAREQVQKGNFSFEKMADGLQALPLTRSTKRPINVVTHHLSDLGDLNLFSVGSGYTFQLPARTLGRILDRFSTPGLQARGVPAIPGRRTSYFDEKAIPDEAEAKKILTANGVWDKKLGRAPNVTFRASALLAEIKNGSKGEAHLTVGFLWALIKEFNSGPQSEDAKEAYKNVFVLAATHSINKLRKPSERETGRNAWEVVYDAMKPNPGVFFDSFTSTH